MASSARSLSGSAGRRKSEDPTITPLFEAVLAKRVSEGEIEDVKHVLPGRDTGSLAMRCCEP
jgi:hypothetical protein